VCILGSEVKKQLFGEREALGAPVFIRDVGFMVIGLLSKKDQNNSYNGMDDNKVLVPYSAMARHFPDPRPFIGPGRVDNIVFSPVSADAHLEAVRQVRRVLARRHGFDPADEGAIWCWDTVQTAGW